MIWAFILVLIVLICVYFLWFYSHWSRRGIDGPTPLPLFGNLFDFLTAKQHYNLIYGNIYKQYSKAKYVGFFRLHKPAVLIRDIDLVQKILVNDFTSFLDNDFHVHQSVDPSQSCSPFSSNGDNGDKWRTTRKNIAPVFSAAKIKAVLPNLQEVAGRLVKYIDELNNDLSHEFEAKKLCYQYTIENIAAAAYGIEGDTFKNPNSKMYEAATRIWESNTFHFIRITCALFLPFLSSIFRISFIPPKSEKWIIELVKSIKKYREENNITRNDFIQSILQLYEKKQITDRFLYGYGVLIFVEGYDTSSSAMSNMLYEMCVNPEIQTKMREEVFSVYEKYGNELSDESLNELTYMDMVFYETLRLHSPLFSLPKICTKRYELPPQYGTSGKGVIIEPGTPILIPSQAIHEDPEHYENPLEFNPERFSEENKKIRNKYTFLAFGEGPRICFGMKYAMTQVKIGIASLLLNYEITLAPRTRVPLKIASNTFVLVAEGGIWIKFKKIK